jgi:hypothetical protein
MPNFLIEKRFEILFAISVIFKKTAQRKVLPNGRKLAQSGHPDPGEPEYWTRRK